MGVGGLGAGVFDEELVDDDGEVYSRAPWMLCTCCSNSHAEDSLLEHCEHCSHLGSETEQRREQCRGQTFSF